MHALRPRNDAQRKGGLLANVITWLLPALDIRKLGSVLSSGEHVALGGRRFGPRTFARDIGAIHLLDVPEAQWQQVFLKKLTDPNVKFSVSLARFLGSTPKEMVLNEMRMGSNTGWELQQIQSAGKLSQVDFYIPNTTQPIENPFK